MKRLDNRENHSIEVIVDVQYWPNLKLWDVIDSIDTRTGLSLGRLSTYGFEHRADYLDRIMLGVVEAILERETLEPETSYSVLLKVFESGKLIGSSVSTFVGNNPPVIPPNWRVTHKKHIFRFLPYEDKDRAIVETSTEYAQRLKTTVLPNFPEEVLIEWFHWHPIVIEEYGFLGFESLQFDHQLWRLDQLPGREAFRSPSICDHLMSTFEQRLKEGNWLASHMAINGTWNTPILLLENSNGDLEFPDGEKMKVPYHLLEGHTRLSFLIALRALGKARDSHAVWIVRKIGTL